MVKNRVKNRVKTGTLWDPYSQMHSKVKYTISVYQHTWFRTGILIWYLDYTWYLTNRFSGTRMVTSGIRYDTSGIRIKFCRYQVSEVRYQVPTQVSESCNPGFSYTCTCTVSDPGTGIPGTCIYTYTWSCSTSKKRENKQIKFLYSFISN